MDITDKTGVLGELWLEFKEDENFREFIKYNDIGLPLAYYIAEGLTQGLTPLGEQYITETFDMLMQLLTLTEEEIDREIGDLVSLTTILFYAHNKREAEQE